jgi:hypothetical protein
MQEIDIDFLKTKSSEIEEWMYKRILEGSKKKRLKNHPEMEKVCFDLLQKVLEKKPATVFQFYMSLTYEIQKYVQGFITKPFPLSLRFWTLTQIEGRLEIRFDCLKIFIKPRTWYFEFDTWLIWGHELGHLLFFDPQYWKEFLVFPRRAKKTYVVSPYPEEGLDDYEEHLADEIAILFLQTALSIITDREKIEMNTNKIFRTDKEDVVFNFPTQS